MKNEERLKPLDRVFKLTTNSLKFVIITTVLVFIFEILALVVGPLSETQEIIDLLVSLAGFIGLIFFMIVFFIWMYRFHKHIKALDSAYKIDHKGMLARFFIPLYNIYGIWDVYATYGRKLESTNKYKMQGNHLMKMLPVFYVLTFVSEAFGRLIVRNTFPEANLYIYPLSSIVDIVLFILWLKMIEIMSQTLHEMKNDPVVKPNK